MKIYNIKNLKVAYKNIKNLNSVVVMYAVNVGARNEIKENYGLSHYIEHMLFKGSKNYTSKEITDSLYENGAELNAYTSHNITAFYTQIDSHYLLKAINILTEMLFNSKLTKKDLEAEKEVVINENIKNRSDPKLLLINKLNTMIYKGTDLEHEIGGKDDIIKKYNRKQVKDYMNKYYNLDNMCLLIIGNIEYSYKNINNYIIKLFSEINPNNLKLNYQKDLIKNFLEYQNEFRYENIIIKLEESYINLGFPVDNVLNIKENCKYEIIANILGGNMSSRLFQILREKNSLVYSVSCNFYEENEIGSINIKFGTKSNKNRILKCLTLIFNEIKKLKTKILKKKELDFNKNYLIGNLKISNDDPMELANFYVANYLEKKKMIGIEEFIRNYKKISSKEIKETAKKIFKVDKCNLVIISKNKIAKKSIEAIMNF